MFCQSAAGLCKNFLIVGAGVGPKESTDWNVKCWTDGNLGMKFNVEEGTR